MQPSVTTLHEALRLVTGLIPADVLRANPTLAAACESATALVAAVDHSGPRQACLWSLHELGLLEPVEEATKALYARLDATGTLGDSASIQAFAYDLRLAVANLSPRDPNGDAAFWGEKIEALVQSLKDDTSSNSQGTSDINTTDPIDLLLNAYAKGEVREGVDWSDLDEAIAAAKALRPGRYEELVAFRENEAEAEDAQR